MTVPIERKVANAIELFEELSSSEFQQRHWLEKTDPSVRANFDEAIETLRDYLIEETAEELAAAQYLRADELVMVRQYVHDARQLAKRMWQSQPTENLEFYSVLFARPEWTELVMRAARILAVLNRVRLVLG